jgi:hypothetical protein
MALPLFIVSTADAESVLGVFSGSDIWYILLLCSYCDSCIETGDKFGTSRNIRYRIRHRCHNISLLVLFPPHWTSAFFSASFLHKPQLHGSLTIGSLFHHTQFFLDSRQCLAATNVSLRSPEIAYTA